MNSKIEQLIEVAKFLDMDNVVEQLNEIRAKLNQKDAQLTIPLVGEFSSGKTSLINALTDAKILETATIPTTASIFAVHFGAPTLSAEVFNSDGTVISVADPTELRNDDLSEAIIVKISDTSTKVSPFTVLVDTPGLSSPDPKHKETLLSFLPQADAVFLVTDINQQITRSMTDFVKSTQLANKRVYLIVTKSDTKSPTELENVKKYVLDNSELPIEDVVFVSAMNDDLDQLFDLLKSIQSDKNHIIQEVSKHRLENISSYLIKSLDELLNASASYKEMEVAIEQLQSELDWQKRNISDLLKDVEQDVEIISRKTSGSFETSIFDRLESLIVTKSPNFDAEAITAVNGTANLLIQQYRTSIYNLFANKADERRNTDKEVSLRALKEIDLSDITMAELSYNMDLNSVGHEYDSLISIGVKTVAVVGAAYVAVSLATAAAAASATATAGTAATTATTAGGASSVLTAGTIISGLDTVSDVGSIISNEKTVRKLKGMQQAKDIVDHAKDSYAPLSEADKRAGQEMGSSKGLVEGVVGLITDTAIGKPQRRKMIQIYLDQTLVPEFNHNLSVLSSNLISQVKLILNDEAETVISQKRKNIEALQKDYNEQESLFKERKSKLLAYKTVLIK